MSLIKLHYVRMNRYDYIIILTIVSVIFAGELFGAFVPIKIIGSLSSIYFVFFFRGWKKDYMKRIKVILAFFVLFLLHVLVSAFWISDVKNYLIASLSLYCYIFDFLLIFVCAQKANKPINSILHGWIVFLLLNLVCSFWEISTGNHFTTGSFQADAVERDIYGTWSNRVYSAVTYGNYNSYALLLCLVMLFVLLYIYFKEDLKNRLFAVFLFFCIVAILFINTSRGSLLSLLFFMVPLWYVIWRLDKIRYLILCFLVIGGTYLWLEYSDWIIFLIQRKLESRSGASDDPRWLLWKAGWDIAIKWLFIGSGPGSMMYEYAQENVFILYAHNLWIQLLVEYGILITCIFAFLYLKLLFFTLFSKDKFLRIIGLYLLLCWPILTIIDEGYMKSFHWIFFASVYSLYYCRKYMLWTK